MGNLDKLLRILLAGILLGAQPRRVNIRNNRDSKFYLAAGLEALEILVVVETDSVDLAVEVLVVVLVEIGLFWNYLFIFSPTKSIFLWLPFLQRALI